MTNAPVKKEVVHSRSRDGQDNGMFRGPDARAHDKRRLKTAASTRQDVKHRTRSRVSGPPVLPSRPNLPAGRPTRIARPEEAPRHVPRLG